MPAPRSSRHCTIFVYFAQMHYSSVRVRFAKSVYMDHVFGEFCTNAIGTLQ